MATKTTYEVHTLKGGRWMVDSTHPKKDVAMEIVRSLHGEKVYEAIKVIKDTYDDATGDAKEIVVYDSGKVSRERATSPANPPSAATKPTAPGGPKADVDFKGGQPTRKKPSKDGMVAVKAIAMLVLILAGGLGVLYLLAGASNFVERLF